MKCPSCRTISRKGDKFCRRCGHNFLHCPKCTADITTNDIFCHKCGMKLTPTKIDIKRKKQKANLIESIKPLKIRKILNNLRVGTWTHEPTLRKRTGLQYDTLKKYLTLLLSQKRICVEIEKKEHKKYKKGNKYKLNRKRLELEKFVELNKSFLEKITKECKSVSYLDALTMFKDLTPEKWELYCEIILEKELLKTHKGHFIFKDNQLKWIRRE